MGIDGSQRFVMRSPNVVADAIDNEVVAVNLETGTYFSLFQQSAWLWSALTTGQSVQTVVESVQDLGPYSKEMVYSFVMELLKYELIEPLSADSPLSQPTEMLPPIPPAPFAPLTINAHMELQDILLLDPVHDSDETGWPEAR